jgi:peptide/nickel transport system permease protein
VVAYLVRRIAAGFLTIFLVVTVAFGLVRLTGDPALLVAGSDATADEIEQIRTVMGTNRPLIEQYVSYVGNFVQGDLGTSIFQRRPVLDILTERLPDTLLLAALSFFLGALLAIPLGVLAALWPNSVTDWLARVVAVIGQCVPTFWLGILLIIVFSVQLQVLPSSGVGSWKHLVLPAVSLSILTTPIVMRILRSSLLDVLHSDYIRMATAKGSSRSRVVLKHGLRNAAVPVVTVLGYRLGVVIGGTVVIETVYAYPGLGSLAVQAVLTRDFPLVQGFLVIIATMVVLLNLIIDFIYFAIDPRIRVA